MGDGAFVVRAEEFLSSAVRISRLSLPTPTLMWTGLSAGRGTGLIVVLSGLIRMGTGKGQMTLAPGQGIYLGRSELCTLDFSEPTNGIVALSATPSRSRSA